MKLQTTKLCSLLCRISGTVQLPVQYKLMFSFLFGAVSSLGDSKSSLYVILSMFQTPHGNWNHTSMEGQPKKQKRGRFPSNRNLSIPEWFQPTLFLIRTLLKFLHQLFYHLSPLQRWLSSNVCVNICEALCLYGLWNKCLLLRCFLHAQYAQRAKYWSAVILLVVKWYISIGCNVLLKFQYGFVLSKHTSTLPSQDCLAVCIVWGVPW